MDFSFTAEQDSLRESLSRILTRHYDFTTRQHIVASAAGFSPEIWGRFGELGLLALPFAEDLGGLGGSLSDQTAVCELVGEALMVEPYTATMLLGGRALAYAIGQQEHKTARSWLARLIAGDAFAAFAHEEGPGTPSPALITSRLLRAPDGRLVLRGAKSHVLGGGLADVLVITARAEDDRLALLLLPPSTPGLHLTRYTGIDGRVGAALACDDVPLPPEAVLLTDAQDVIARVIAEGILALAAETVGAMGALLRATASYAQTRRQFGVPIGSFQVVAHRLADMKMAYTLARATLLYSTALAETGVFGAGRFSATDLAVLKAQIGKLGRGLGEGAIQTHGGIAMTDELAIGHYHKRILAFEMMFGQSEVHFRTLGTA